MPQAADYSSARPAPADLAADGYIGALRYLANLPNPKVITGDELASLHANNLAVGFVWEVGTDWTTWNGAEADRQLDDLGVPDSIPVYWAVDRDWSDYALVGRMLDGVNSRRPRGSYGGSGLVQYQLDNGHARYGWIAAATSWGHGQPAPGAHLRQLVGGAPPGCDVNDILQDDWGQWPAPEDDMGNAKGPFMVRFGTDGNVYCVQSDGYFHVVDEAHRDRMKLYGLVQTDPAWENGCVQVHPEHERADILFGRPLDA